MARREEILDAMQYVVERYVPAADKWVNVAVFASYGDALYYEKMADELSIEVRILEL